MNEPAAVPIGGRALTLRDVEAVARGGARVVLEAQALERVRAARRVVERYAAGEAPVYGVNTGLGGNLAYRIAPEAIEAFQQQLVRGRAVGVGAMLPLPVCRAALLARVQGMARGAAGVSPAVLELMLAMLAAGVTPLIPGRGSIGAGDLVLGAAMGLVVIGGGEADFRGRRLPGAEALAQAGLAPARLGPKDGLALLNASAVTTGMAALVLADLERLVTASLGAAALAFDGYAGNPSIFDARLAAARPARGQVRAAALFRALLAGSALHRPGASRAIQDALSFRCLSQVAGTLLAAVDTAREDVLLELNAAADNPTVLPEDEEMLSSGNFHTPAIALAFDTLAIALASHAAASAQRVVKLMTPALSGLPRYLSPAGGASAGMVPMQKTVAALLGEIRHRANPASLDAIAVSDTVEDHAPQTLLAVSRLGEQMQPFALLVAIEALVAAQAADLRHGADISSALGAGSRQVHAMVRKQVPMLVEDRENGVDAMRVHEMLASGELATALAPVLAGVPGT